MIRKQLLAWQWTDYARYHGSRLNRALHLVGAPLFVAGALAIPIGLANGTWRWVALGSLSMALGFGVQAVGHKRLEAHPAIPFAGPGDALTRIFTEQFVTFWRFVLSGFRGSR